MKKFLMAAKKMIGEKVNALASALLLFSISAITFTEDALAITAGDIKNSWVTNFIIPAIDGTKWVAILAGGSAVFYGFMQAYKKAGDQGRDVEMKSIFVPIIIGGALISLGFIVSAMSDSTTQAGVATTVGQSGKNQF